MGYKRYMASLLERTLCSGMIPDPTMKISWLHSCRENRRGDHENFLGELIAGARDCGVVLQERTVAQRFATD